MVGRGRIEGEGERNRSIPVLLYSHFELSLEMIFISLFVNNCEKTIFSDLCV